MDPGQKENIKKNIEKEIVKTKQLISDYIELTKPIAPENAIGRVSRMDAINNKSINEAALKLANQKFISLKIALESIDETTFGICVKCNSEIPLGRILIRPQSRLCVPCAS